MCIFRYGDKTPKGPFARILAVIWILISAIFLSLFTANASSILAMSQAEEDHANTIGKKIGCFNSKHFYDVELNLGAQLIGYRDLFSFILATQTGEINRLVFPNYLDFLYLRMKPNYKSLNDGFLLTNTLNYPFQIGMAFAVDSANMTAMEQSFLKCFRRQLPTLEKQIRRQEIEPTKVKGDSQVEKMKVPLESESLLTHTYWFFVIIVCFSFIGFCRDYWVFRKRSRANRHDPDQQGDNDTDGVFYTDMDGGSRSPKHNSSIDLRYWGGNVYKMSITGSCVPPTQHPR